MVLLGQRVVGQPEYLLVDGGSSLPRFGQDLGVSQVQEKQEGEQKQHHPGSREGLDWLEEL